MLVQTLAEGATDREAARRCGVSSKTVQRRRQDPKFMAKVVSTRETMISKATEGLANAADKAVKTLEQLLDAESETVKLGASRAILDGLVRFQELESLAERVRQLEESKKSARTFFERMTGEQIEEFYFELHASLKGKGSERPGV